MNFRVMLSLRDPFAIVCLWKRVLCCNVRPLGRYFLKQQPARSAIVNRKVRSCSKSLRQQVCDLPNRDTSTPAIIVDATPLRRRRHYSQLFRIKLRHHTSSHPPFSAVSLLKLEIIQISLDSSN